MSVIFMSVNFMPGHFDGPSFSCPSFSAPPSRWRPAQSASGNPWRGIVVNVPYSVAEEWASVVFSIVQLQQIWHHTDFFDAENYQWKLSVNLQFSHVIGLWDLIFQGTIAQDVSVTTIFMSSREDGEKWWVESSDRFRGRQNAGFCEDLAWINCITNCYQISEIIQLLDTLTQTPQFAVSHPFQNPGSAIVVKRWR